MRACQSLPVMSSGRAGKPQNGRLASHEPIWSARTAVNLPSSRMRLNTLPGFTVTLAGVNDRISTPSLCKVTLKRIAH